MLEPLFSFLGAPDRALLRVGRLFPFLSVKMVSSVQNVEVRLHHFQTCKYNRTWSVKTCAQAIAHCGRFVSGLCGRTKHTGTQHPATPPTQHRRSILRVQRQGERAGFTGPTIGAFRPRICVAPIFIYRQP